MPSELLSARPGADRKSASPQDEAADLPIPVAAPPVTWGAEETIRGTEGNDTLEPGSSSYYILGRDGDDVLFGGPGGGYLVGGPGDDFFFGGLGQSYYRGGRGVDTLSFELAPTGCHIPLGEQRNPQVGQLYWDALNRIERAIGSPFDDVMVGSTADDYLDSGDGDDLIYRSGGRDTMIGGAGKDTIHAATGDDLITLGRGADHLYLHQGRTSHRITDLSEFDEISTWSFDPLPDEPDLEPLQLVSAFTGAGCEMMWAYDPVADLSRLIMDFDGDRRSDMTTLFDGDQRGFDNFLIDA